MAVFIISAAAVVDASTGKGAIGYDLWSSAPDVSRQFGTRWNDASNIGGPLLMVLLAMEEIGKVAVSGDIVQIAIEGGEEAMQAATYKSAFETHIPGAAVMALARRTEALERDGLSVRWLDPTAKHSGITHAKVAARQAALESAEMSLPLAA
jgi:hypothetical protein